MIDEIKSWEINYYKSDTIETQGKYSKIQKYMNQGYFIKENRNGYWVLNKPANVILTVVDSNDNQYYFYIKQYILDYYNKYKITEKLFQKFKNEINQNKDILINLINNNRGYK